MKDFDEYLRKKAESENREIPIDVKNKIETTLENLPEDKSNKKGLKLLPRIVSLAASIVLVLFVLMPNISGEYARALASVPVIGDFVRVVTVRKYEYSDEKHNLEVEVPEVDGSDSFNPINADVNELTEKLVQRFYEEVELVGNEGHGSLYIDYETVTNTDTWFTLKLCVFEAAGSSNTYYKYYHLNKLTGKTVQLGDLAKSKEFYSVIEEDLKRQMDEAMKNDEDLVYWTHNTPFGDNLVSIDECHNFRFDEEGNIVICFDKYEVSPGFMGTPEFTVDKTVFEDYVKAEFKDIV